MTEPSHDLDGQSLLRKNATLERRLTDLRERGDDTSYNRNALVAENEVAWEIGVFSHNGQISGGRKPISDEDREGLIIRSRMDGIVSKLNSVDAAKSIDRIEHRLQEIQRAIIFIAAAVVVIAIMVLSK